MVFKSTSQKINPSLIDKFHSKDHIYILCLNIQNFTI